MIIIYLPVYRLRRVCPPPARPRVPLPPPVNFGQFLVNDRAVNFEVVSIKAIRRQVGHKRHDQFKMTLELIRLSFYELDHQLE